MQMAFCLGVTRGKFISTSLFDNLICVGVLHLTDEDYIFLIAVEKLPGGEIVLKENTLHCSIYYDLM
jgi:hypothetical protein